MKKFIMLIKNKWLRQTSLTLLLVAIILAIFIAGNFILNKAKLNPIDFTKEKIYTLSDESKNQIKDIEQNVTMYIFGYEDGSTPVVLGNQYHDTNEKITVQLVNTTDRPDLVAKFNISEDSQLVAISSNQRYKIISSSEMYSSDYTNNSSMDLTEQKLTNAILNVTVASKPQIYFLTGHNEYGISSSSEYGSSQEMYSFAQYITNEIMDVHTLDLLTTKNMPAECDVLVIANPMQDFTDSETEIIQTYINNGGKIMWMQDPYVNIRNYNKDNYKNINKILDQFGISFSYGIVCESNADLSLAGAPGIIIPNLTYNEIVKDLYTDGKVVMPYAGRIQNVDSDKMSELKITTSDFVKSSIKSYFREKNLEQDSYFTMQNDDETGPFIIGETITKKLDDDENGKKAILVAYSSAMFATSYQIPIDMQTAIIPIQLRNNRDLALNTIAYLANREDSIRIRKDTGLVSFESPTETQQNIVMTIVFGVPLAFIIIGIIVTIIRKKKGNPKTR